MFGAARSPRDFFNYRFRPDSERWRLVHGGSETYKWRSREVALLWAALSGAATRRHSDPLRHARSRLNGERGVLTPDGPAAAPLTDQPSGDRCPRPRHDRSIFRDSDVDDNREKEEEPVSGGRDPYGLDSFDERSLYTTRYITGRDAVTQTSSSHRPEMERSNCDITCRRLISAWLRHGAAVTKIDPPRLVLSNLGSNIKTLRYLGWLPGSTRPENIYDENNTTIDSCAL